MGYTHYWYRDEKIKPEKYSKIVEDVRKAIDILKKDIELANWDGTGDPNISSTDISFNGTSKDDQYHETFSFPLVYEKYEHEIPKDGKYFEFCKTARKPYDLVVCVILLIIKRHLNRTIRVSSDGFTDYDSSGLEGTWPEAVKFVEKHFGYKAKFQVESRVLDWGNKSTVYDASLISVKV
jgi:hypothetical protein